MGWRPWEELNKAGWLNECLGGEGHRRKHSQRIQLVERHHEQPLLDGFFFKEFIRTARLEGSHLVVSTLGIERKKKSMVWLVVRTPWEDMSSTVGRVTV